MYILKLGNLPPDNKIEQIKKFRKATGYMLRSSKEVIDQVETYGKYEISSGFLNQENIRELKREGFRIENNMPKELFHIEY